MRNRRKIARLRAKRAAIERRLARIDSMGLAPEAYVAIAHELAPLMDDSKNHGKAREILSAHGLTTAKYATGVIRSVFRSLPLAEKLREIDERIDRLERSETG